MISSQLRKVIWLGNSYHIITVDNEREIVAMQTVKFIKNVTNMNDQDKYVDKQAKLKNRPRT
jgi:carboxylesterase